MMKKHFKKLVSLVLSLIMVVGMSVTTFAAEVQPAAGPGADDTQRTGDHARG